MRVAVIVLLFGIVACAPLRQAEGYAMIGCYAFQHPAETDTVFLDSLPPTSTDPVTDGVSWRRALLFPYLADTLTAEQRVRDIEVSLRWRQLADSVYLRWSNGQEAVMMTGRWRPDSFVVQALHRWVEDGPDGSVDTISSSFVHIPCPGGWPGPV